MKKSVIAIVLIGTVLSSCGYYTCPTYSKRPAKLDAEKAARETRI